MLELVGVTLDRLPEARITPSGTNTSELNKAAIVKTDMKILMLTATPTPSDLVEYRYVQSACPTARVEAMRGTAGLSAGAFGECGGLAERSGRPCDLAGPAGDGCRDQVALFLPERGGREHLD